MIKPKTDIDTIKFLLGIYNDAIRHSNRLWYWALFFALIFFSSHAIQIGNESGANNQSVLWFMNVTFAKPAMLLAIAGANMAYCNSHIVQYDIGKIWTAEAAKYRDENKGEEFDELLFLAPVSSFNRLYPSLGYIAKRNYTSLKTLFDFILCGAPFFALIVGSVIIACGAADYYYWVKGGVVLLIIPSAMFTISLWKRVFGWPFPSVGNSGKEGHGNT